MTDQDYKEAEKYTRKNVGLLQVRWTLAMTIRQLRILATSDPSLKKELDGLEIVLSLLDKRLDDLGFVKEQIEGVKKS